MTLRGGRFSRRPSTCGSGQVSNPHFDGKMQKLTVFAD
jgi:hypothetical protein